DRDNPPARVAVSLLKNSKGQIYVRIPISGSLSDPKFSIGAIVLGAFMNMIVKDATSPFTLIASAFGGSGGAQHDTGGYKEASLDRSIKVLRRKAVGDIADGTGKNAALSTEYYNKYLAKAYS